MNDATPRVTAVAILPSNTQQRRYQAVAMAEFSDGSMKDVLAWYDDEIHFSESDFLGKSQEQISRLFMERDGAYLRS